MKNIDGIKENWICFLAAVNEDFAYWTDFHLVMKRWQTTQDGKHLFDMITKMEAETWLIERKTINRINLLGPVK